MKRPPSVTERAITPRPRMPIAVLVRMFLFGAISIGAAGYASYHYYFGRARPALAPVPSEIPAPELVPIK